MQQISKYLSVEQSPPTVPFVSDKTRDIVREPLGFREELISKFIIRLLLENKDTKWEPKTPLQLNNFKRRTAILINRNPFLRESWQLESFWKQCERSKNFGKTFNWAVKQKYYGEI